MRLFYTKLSSGKGETLVETVVAVLVVALASVIFATMTLSASRLNAAAMDADEAFYSELSAVEQQTGTTSGTVTVSWDSTSENFAVMITGADGELRGYADGGGGG